MSGRKSVPRIGIGYRVGHLTVEAKTGEKHSGYVVWRCRYDCGGEICLDTRFLQRGATTNCGCMKRVKPGQKDLTGMRFGKLVCLEATDQRSKSGSVMWRCICDCGKERMFCGQQTAAIRMQKELRMPEPSTAEGIYRETLWTAGRNGICMQAWGNPLLEVHLRLWKGNRCPANAAAER